MQEAVRSVINSVDARPGNKLTRLVASLGPLIQKKYSPLDAQRGKTRTSQHITPDKTSCLFTKY